MEEYQVYLQRLDDYYRQTIHVREPVELYQPIEYVMQLGGKRMRPLLLMLAHALYDDEAQRALPAALAIEVFHNFTLIHDDIMDAAPLRRGFPSVHIKYGTNTGILSGDAMLIMAYDLLTRNEDARITHDLVGVFSEVALQVCEGQQLDVNFESEDDVSLEQYIDMIALKTAVLLAASLKMGAIVGGASESDREHLYTFGRLSGLAFQIQDDYLDVFGDPKKFGKRVGGDILQNKKTALYLTALAKANNQQRDRLTNLYSTFVPDGEQAAKVAEVTSLMQAMDVPTEVCRLRDRYQEEAYAHLEQVDAPPARIAAIRRLADQLLQRDY